MTRSREFVWNGVLLLAQLRVNKPAHLLSRIPYVGVPCLLRLASALGKKPRSAMPCSW
jgi:hypothetical protein